MKNKSKLEKFLVWFVLSTLVLSAAYAIVNIILAEPGMLGSSRPRVKSDYVLSLLQCLLGIAAMTLPSLLSKHLGLKIPSRVFYMYLIFLYCAIYLGEVRSFYFLVPHWDTVLHSFSGAMLGALGFSIVEVLTDHRGAYVRLSPKFIALFAFCFALAIGVFWEIYEFAADGLLGLNMQKFMLADGDLLIGRDALTDTMKDLIVDAVGAGAAVIAGYFTMAKTPSAEAGIHTHKENQNGKNSAS